MRMLVSSISELIGNTPLVELRGFNKKHGTCLFGKVEFFNIGGSIKDRTALGLIKHSITTGQLKPGMTAVESTSGNLGISLALLSKEYNFKLICIVDPKIPTETLLFYEAYGVQVEFIEGPDADGGFQKARIARAREIAAQDKNCVNLDQYSNSAARDIHYETTGFEIVSQMEGKLGAVVANVSTGSHLSGIARYVKQCDPDIRTVAVEPEGSVIFGGEFHPYQQNGSGLSFTPENYDRQYIDEEVKVADEDAVQTVRKLVETDGLLVGVSSGAALHAARDFSRRPENRDRRCVVIFPDSGVKYLKQLQAL